MPLDFRTWLTWAEEFGLGEMGLSPREFWSLTFREFQIKFRAFTRAENRMRSLILEHSLISVSRKDKERNQLQRAVNSLRQYPVKSWLRSE